MMSFPRTLASLLIYTHVCGRQPIHHVVLSGGMLLIHLSLETIGCELSLVSSVLELGERSLNARQLFMPLQVIKYRAEFRIERVPCGLKELFPNLLMVSSWHIIVSVIHTLATEVL